MLGLLCVLSTHVPPLTPNSGGLKGSPTPAAQCWPAGAGPLPGGQWAAGCCPKEVPPSPGNPCSQEGAPCSQCQAPQSTRPHLGDLNHGLAKFFDLVFTVHDVPEVLMSPVLKQEPRDWGDRPTQRP